MPQGMIERTIEPGAFLVHELKKCEVNQFLYDGIKVLVVDQNGSKHERIVTVSRNNFMLFVSKKALKSTSRRAAMKSVVSPSASKESVSRRYLKSSIKDSVKDISRNSIPNNRLGFSKYFTSIDISEITSMHRSSTESLNLTQQDYPQSSDVKNKLLTIFYNGSTILDLILMERDRDNLFKAITNLITCYKKNKINVTKEEILLRYYCYNMKTTDDSLNRKEVEALMNSFNIHICERSKNEYEKLLTNEKRSYFRRKKCLLTHSNFIEFLHRLKESDESLGKSMENTIWERFFGENVDKVSKETFLKKFLQEQERSNIDEIFEVFNNQTKSDFFTGSDYMNRLQFGSFLHSDFNQAFNVQEIDTSRMDFPLTHYWISSSHNTYSSGNQLTSDSSCQMYVKALHNGCKCLELDCWDGSRDRFNKNIPVVKHGHTLTSQITFVDVITVVREYVEDNPETYPIILSLENHCSLKYQQEIVEILKFSLGEMLYKPATGNERSTKDMPSPNYLRGKVLIKGKKSTPSEEENDEEQRDASLRKIGILPELAALALLDTISFKSFDASIDQDCFQMHSIQENKMNKIIEKNEEDIIKWRHYNANHLTRTFPKFFLRFDSSNYNPLIAWAMGCQLVALNIQTTGSPVLLNNALFSLNGKSGYVLKPQWMIKAPFTKKLRKVILNIRVLSGSCLPKQNGELKGECIDPYVIICLYDIHVKPDGNSNMSDNCAIKEHTHVTSVIKNNGFSPIWNEEEFKEFEIFNMDLAMLKISLKEKDVLVDDHIGDAVIPVRNLKSGVRNVRLCNKDGSCHGPFNFATILLEINWK